MTTPFDCHNSMSEHGRNLTPVSIVDAAIATLGKIDLDPASDELANRAIRAERYFSLADDGYSQPWEANTLFLNPPGKTRSNGREVKSADWARKLTEHWQAGDVAHAIYVCYRASSLGSLGGMLPHGLVCLTASNADNNVVSGGGRLSFEIVIEGERIPQKKNPSSSAFVLLSTDPKIQLRFVQQFSQFGVVLGQAQAA